MQENCREKITKSFSVDNMVKTLDNEFHDLINKGTRIKPETVKDIELYKQYLVLYNVIEERKYNIPVGGITNRRSNIKTANLKSNLWKNPFYRITVKTLKGIGLWEPLKKSKITKKLKTVIRKVM